MDALRDLLLFNRHRAHILQTSQFGGYVYRAAAVAQMCLAQNKASV